MSVDGLRERKRAATEAAIERAAIDLALEHGYEQVTVDMICEAAMISPRTFFNYFGSKEGVILGGPPPMPTEEAVAAFAQQPGASLLGDFVELITGPLLDLTPDMGRFKARRAIIVRTPELLTKELARRNAFEDEYVAMILRRFDAQGRTAPAAELEDEARMLVALSTGVIHFLARRWFGDQPATPSRELLARAIDLVQRITDDAPSAKKGTAVLQ